MKTFIFFLFLLFFFSAETDAQPVTFSEVVYDVQTPVYGEAVVKAFDPGFMIAGSINWGGQDGMILRIDSAGQLLVGKKISGTSFSAITATFDSCFVAAGKSIVKLDRNADTLWCRAFNGDMEALSIQQTNDSGYVFTGYEQGGSPSYFTKIFVAKLGGDGNLQWSKEFSGIGMHGKGYSVRQAPDSGFIITGYDSTDAFLLKLDAAGSFGWAKRYNLLSHAACIGSDLLLATDGVICCFAADQSQIILAKTDFTGSVTWSESFTNLFAPGAKLIRTRAGQYVIAGTFFPESFGSSPMIQVDSAGNLFWWKDLYVSVTDLVEANDTGLLVIGNGPLIAVRGPFTYSPQIGIIKTDSSGNGIDCIGPGSSFNVADTLTSVSAAFSSLSTPPMMTFTPVVDSINLLTISGCVDVKGAVNEINNEDDISIYPVPANDKIFVESKGENLAYDIYDLSGNLLRREDIGSRQFEIDFGNLASGMYFVCLVEKGKKVYRKIIKS